jgi:hypothetical protein
MNRWSYLCANGSNEKLKAQMMRKLILIGLIIIVSAPVFSQIRFGIKAGAETTTVPTYELGNGAATIDALKDASWGYHVGIFLRFGLGPIYLQPEAVFASTSFDYNVTTTDLSELKTQKFNRLSIPVLLGLKLGPLRFNAGPAASIMIGSPSALIDDPNFENMYKGAVYGYQAGIGLDILKTLTLDIRYAGSLGEKFGDTVTIGGQTFKLDYGQSSLLLSVGLMF